MVSTETKQALDYLLRATGALTWNRCGHAGTGWQAISHGVSESRFEAEVVMREQRAGP